MYLSIVDLGWPFEDSKRECKSGNEVVCSGGREETPSFASHVFLLGLGELMRDREEVIGEVFFWFVLERQRENREAKT